MFHFYPKSFPRRFPDAPRRPKMTQETPRESPRRPQDAPKTLPRRPQETPRGRPGGFLGGPGGIRERPEARSRSGAAQDRQNTTKRFPKCRQNDPRKFKKLPKKNFKMIQESSSEHLPKRLSEASIGPRLGDLYHRFME